METKLVSKEPLKFIGLSKRTNNQNIEEIANQWKTFLEKDMVQEIPNKIDAHTSVAMYSQYQNGIEGDYTFTLGTFVDSIERVPSQMTGIEIPASMYGVVTARGELPGSIQHAWEYIWSDKFPYERTFTYDFEVYAAEKIAAEIPEVDIYVAVKPDSE